MRLDVSLIDARTERVLWSEIFERSFEDIFEVELEVAIALSSSIMVEIDHQERARVRARDPNSLDAYELCLRGLDDMLRLDRSGCDSALALFTRAEQREHGYARALSGSLGRTASTGSTAGSTSATRRCRAPTTLP